METEVLCVRDGIVTEVGSNKGYGNYIKYKTYDDYVIMYAHLSQSDVKEGDKIKKGEVVAKSGNTGLSTGPHLHYTIWLNDDVLNPRKFTSF